MKDSERLKCLQKGNAMNTEGLIQYKYRVSFETLAKDKKKGRREELRKLAAEAFSEKILEHTEHIGTAYDVGRDMFATGFGIVIMPISVLNDIMEEIHRLKYQQVKTKKSKDISPDKEEL